MILFPVFFYSSRKSASNFLSVAIYSLVYISTVIALQSYFASYVRALPYQIVIMLSMILLFQADRFVLGRKEIVLGRGVSLITWLKFGIGIALFVLSLYVLRATEMFVFSIVGNSLLDYAVSWLIYFFIPLFIVVGLKQEKRVLVVASISLALFVSLLSGLIVAILLSLLTVMCYIGLRQIHFEYFFPIMIAFASCGQIGNTVMSTANSNLLLTDGIEYLGIWNLVIAAIVLFVLLVYLNKLSARHDLNVVFILLLGFPLSLANMSLLTSLLSSGLLLVLVFLRYSKNVYSLV